MLALHVLTHSTPVCAPSQPFDGREDVRIYRNCTCFALSCESEVRRLDPKTETLEYDESVIKLTR